MSNNVKIALAVVVLAVAGYFIISSMGSDGSEKSRPEDRIMRTNQTDETAPVGSKTIEFEIEDVMAHYGQG